MANSIFEITDKIRDFFGGFISPNLLWFQLGSLVLSGLFLWGTVYILSRVHYFNLKIEDYIDRGMGNLFQYRAVRAWKRIKKRLATNDKEQWKTAILESDDLLNEILKMSGQLGIELGDKLVEMTGEQLSNIEDVRRAHQTVVSIKTDPNFSLTQEIVLEVMLIYRQAFMALNLID